MQVRDGELPRARQLARTEEELSREGPSSPGVDGLLPPLSERRSHLSPLRDLAPDLLSLAAPL
jgi:hypothetical protein